MNFHSDNDNIYKLGSILTSKMNATLKLVVVKYYQRIYYCAELNNLTKKHLAYFENELNPPLLDK